VSSSRKIVDVSYDGGAQALAELQRIAAIKNFGTARSEACRRRWRFGFQFLAFEGWDCLPNLPNIFRKN